MVQLVFVHGVATRSGAGYDAGVANRNRLLTDILFEGTQVTIQSPLWGDFVPSINQDVFATAGGIASFSLGGSAGGLGGGLGSGLSGHDGDGTDLAAVARTNPTAALDAVFAALLEQAEVDGRELSDDDVAAFRSATATISSGVSSSALAGVATDDDLIMELEKDASASYGILGPIKDAVTAVTDRLRNVVSTIAFDAVRDQLSPAVGFFLGDVFVYLKDGAVRAKIRDAVTQAIASAHQAAAAQGEKVVIIGHSLGGVILYDILSDPPPALPAAFSVSALLTVGSQPGLFQSLGLFRNSPSSGQKTPKPACVETWYNVFDPIDPLAFRAAPLFAGVEDLVFDSVTGLASAHTTYFKRPQFYARARKRLHDLNLL